MGAYTPIEWADASLNYWEGCTHASPGCKLCYADRLATRRGTVQWGPKGKRRLVKSNPQILRAINGRVNKGEVSKNGTGRLMVFVNDISDLFEGFETMPEESWDDVREARKRCWADVEANPWLVFQFLTKRPENVMDMIPSGWRDGFPPNVWMGTSAENQEWLEKRMGAFDDIPCDVRFLSAEPLIGSIETRASDEDGQPLAGSGFLYEICKERAIDWVICGGESDDKGRARPMHPEWARSLRDQCVAAGVPYFFKQWGEWAPFIPNNEGLAYEITKGDTSLLDGQLWQQFPEVV